MNVFSILPCGFFPLFFTSTHYQGILWVGKIPWRRKWQSTPVFFPGKSHGQRSLAGYSPWGHRESDDWVTNTHTEGHLSIISLVNTITQLLTSFLSHGDHCIFTVVVCFPCLHFLPSILQPLLNMLLETSSLQLNADPKLLPCLLSEIQMVKAFQTLSTPVSIS